MPRALLHTTGLLSYGFDSKWCLAYHPASASHLHWYFLLQNIYISKADNTAVHSLDNPSKLSGNLSLFPANRDSYHYSEAFPEFCVSLQSHRNLPDHITFPSDASLLLHTFHNLYPQDSSQYGTLPWYTDSAIIPYSYKHPLPLLPY